MTEDNVDVGVVFLECWEDVLCQPGLRGGYLVQLVHHDFAEWTDIVDVDFNRMTSGVSDTVAFKSWIESH